MIYPKGMPGLKVRARELTRKITTLADYGAWLVFDLKKFKKIRNERIRKVLVVLINQSRGNVGGDVCTLGVTRCFARNFPHVHTTLLGDEATIKNLGNVEDINTIIFEGKKTLEKLHNETFDAAVFMNAYKVHPNDFPEIPYKISKTTYGLKGALRMKKKFGYTRKVYNWFGGHMVDLRFRMFEALGFTFTKKHLEFIPTRQDEKKVAAFLKKHKIKKYVIVHPGGKYVAEQYQKGKHAPHLWPLERYAEVAQAVQDQGYATIITGTKDESILAETIAKRASVINASGMFSISEVAALLKNAHALIATDTAIVHLAYQVDTPIVELMGPSLPEIVGAWPLKDPRHTILLDGGPCARSMRKVSCPKGVKNCLERIQAQEVISATQELIAKAR